MVAMLTCWTTLKYLFSNPNTTSNSLRACYGRVSFGGFTWNVSLFLSGDSKRAFLVVEGGVFCNERATSFMFLGNLALGLGGGIALVILVFSAHPCSCILLFASFVCVTSCIFASSKSSPLIIFVFLSVPSPIHHHQCSSWILARS